MRRRLFGLFVCPNLGHDALIYPCGDWRCSNCGATGRLDDPGTTYTSIQEIALCQPTQLTNYDGITTNSDLSGTRL